MMMPLSRSFLTLTLLLLSTPAAVLSDDVGQGPNFPTVCVKFGMFDNPHCDGKPTRVVKYPTYKHPGHSPCLADPAHPFGSLGDQYCDLDHDVYHFDYYPLNGKCEGDPIKLKIPADGGCTLGLKVYHCQEKLCFPEGDEELGNIAEELAALQQNFLDEMGVALD